MIYVKLQENNSIDLIHYMPFDSVNGLGKSREELEKSGFFVQEVPQPVEKPGKYAVLYGNKSTKELWYEYRDMPLTPEEQTRRDVELMKKALDELLLGGM